MQASTEHVHIRTAMATDLSALISLEQHSFSGDRLSPRRLRHWIQADNGIVLVAASNAQVLAYCLVIMRRNSLRARLYSIATAPAARGQGLAARLLSKAEQQTISAGCTAMFLEVAEHNQQALSLYQKQGYRQFARIAAYYEDGQNALRMKKALKIL